MSNAENDKKLIGEGNSGDAVEASGKEPSILTQEGAREMIEQFKGEFRKEMEQVKNEFRKETERQVLLERASLITVFGLFASITSFLIIEFQCLKVLTGICGIVGFSCTAFALLLGFNIGLDYLVKSRFDKGLELHKTYIAFVAIFFVIGCLFIVYDEWQAHWCKKESVCEMLERVEQAKIGYQEFIPTTPTTQ